MMDSFMDKMFLGNRIMDYMLCLVYFLAGMLILKIFERYLFKRLKKWSEATKTSIDDFIVNLTHKVLLPFGYLLILYFSVNTLYLLPSIRKMLSIIIMAVLTFFGARLVTTIIGYMFDVYWRKRGKTVAFERSLSGILRLINFIVWSMAIIFLLDNLGFKISAVIAGLGVGGVAVALAAQAVLGDLFSYFAILFDRPFEIGDFIIVGDFMGVVEKIGIKTTRISSLGGEQLIFSNTDLTNSRVRNYKRMQKRRVLFPFGVTYETSLEKVKEIPGIIENIIKGVEETEFDRAHFFKYGDFSLDFEVVYYVIGGDYNKYMDIQQRINIAIKEEFESRGIEFAYPTQTLYVSK